MQPKFLVHVLYGSCCQVESRTPSVSHYTCGITTPIGIPWEPRKKFSTWASTRRLVHSRLSCARSGRNDGLSRLSPPTCHLRCCYCRRSVQICLASSAAVASAHHSIPRPRSLPLALVLRSRWGALAASMIAGWPANGARQATAECLLIAGRQATGVGRFRQ
jgi:hypothetical protein